MKKEQKGYLLKIVKKYKNKEILGIAISLFYSFLAFLIPYTSKYLIDSMTQKQTVNQEIFILIFFVISILQPILGYFKDVIFKNISESITYEIKSNLFSNILEAQFVFFEKTAKGEVLSRIVNDGDKASNFLTNIWLILIGDIIFLCIGMIEIFLLSRQIFFLIICGLLVYFIYNLYVDKVFEKLSEKNSAINDKICTIIEQSINNIELIKTFSAEKKINNLYLKFLNTSCQTNKKTEERASFYNGISETIVIITTSLLYYFGFNLLAKNKLTIGTIIALVSYFQMLLSPVHDLISFNIEYHKIVPITKRLFTYLNLPKEIDHINLPKLTVKKTPTLVFNNVSFHYKDGTNILEKLSFQFEGPGLYCFVGSSGIGKSTVARLILGLYQPCQGNINVFLNKKSITSLKELRSNISYVSQNSEMSNATLRENLTLGCSSDISDNKLTEVCKKLGLSNKIKTLSDGYNTIINEKINFSGGEIQRVAIARALLKDSPINIFDELTSSLDETNFQNVLKIIKEMQKSKMVILITHRLEILKDANQVINLEKFKN